MPNRAVIDRFIGLDTAESVSRDWNEYGVRPPLLTECMNMDWDMKAGGINSFRGDEAYTAPGGTPIAGYETFPHPDSNTGYVAMVREGNSLRAYDNWVAPLTTRGSLSLATNSQISKFWNFDWIVAASSGDPLMEYQGPPDDILLVGNPAPDTAPTAVVNPGGILALGNYWYKYTYVNDADPINNESNASPQSAMVAIVGLPRAARLSDFVAGDVNYNATNINIYRAAEDPLNPGNPDTFYYITTVAATTVITIDTGLNPPDLTRPEPTDNNTVPLAAPERQVSFYNHLFISNGNTIYWCKQGIYDLWPANNFHRFQDRVVDYVVLNGFLYIFLENTRIFRCSYTATYSGIGDLTSAVGGAFAFAFEEVDGISGAYYEATSKVVTEIPQAIVYINSKHELVLFNGRGVFQTIRGRWGKWAEESEEQRYWVQYYKWLNQVWILVDTSSTYAGGGYRRTFVFDIDNGGLSERDPRDAYCFGSGFPENEHGSLVIGQQSTGASLLVSRPNLHTFAGGAINSYIETGWIPTDTLEYKTNYDGIPVVVSSGYAVNNRNDNYITVEVFVDFDESLDKTATSNGPLRLELPQSAGVAYLRKIIAFNASKYHHVKLRFSHNIQGAGWGIHRIELPYLWKGYT